ncbi:uncharacterized protein K452DRAFT_336538 [Aplosporella prunicola CBS 121167]|uniref:Fucose-specific lectin n=1 Tax=Aplosporella prunicola CBS 121167 TaxID=1176127 RepID=A0A6A6BQQ2_9PEZI|nr:uncharacterized protein K452DRAFT_336538 [Aplosporella prunicola CBS 121167]KAF2146416.1 hypothetical protein K452DRAFT_336538 [Aplosporella prunicola CBS 121167]
MLFIHLSGNTARASEPAVDEMRITCRSKVAHGFCIFPSIMQVRLPLASHRGYLSEVLLASHSPLLLALLDMDPHSPHSTLEVDHSDYQPEVIRNEPERPLAESNNLPEVVTQRSKMLGSGEKAPSGFHGWKRGRITAVILTLLIAIGVGVGVGVGVGMSRHHEGAASITTAFLPNTRLAAVNYTDSKDALHHLVFYQKDTLAIWQADFDNSSGKWVLSEIQTTFTPKRETPIAVDVQEPREIHLYFLDKGNNIRQLKYSDKWSLGPIDKIFVAHEDSKLASYSKQCSICREANYLVYQRTSGNGSLEIVQYTLDGVYNSSSVFFSREKTPNVDNADFTMATLLGADNKEPTVSLFVNTGVLEQFLYIDYKFQDWNLSRSISSRYHQNTNRLGDRTKIDMNKDSSITALTQSEEGKRLIQVLTTGENGGVTVARYYGVDSDWESIKVQSMNKVRALSPISANQAGRVYAFVGTQLYEWYRVEDCGGSICRFEEIGIVDI